eukprot:141333-Prymnesium_polylepis.1
MTGSLRGAQNCPCALNSSLLHAEARNFSLKIEPSLRRLQSVRRGPAVRAHGTVARVRQYKILYYT